jgi:hypothetical protein
MNLHAYEDMGVVYTIRTYNVDGGARDDAALVLFDVDDEPVARQWFDASELDGSPTAGPRVADWLRDVTFALLNTEQREMCGDCGNPQFGLAIMADPERNHAPDCPLYGQPSPFVR